MSSAEFSIFITATFTAVGSSSMNVNFPLPSEAILRAGKPAKPYAVEKWKNGLSGQVSGFTSKTDKELLVAIRRLRSR